MPSMAHALLIFGVAFAPCCVWLTVRIVNRRERWAKWMLTTVLAASPILYVLSLGPAVGIENRSLGPDWLQNRLRSGYEPVFWLLDYTPDSVNDAYWEILSKVVSR